MSPAPDNRAPDLWSLSDTGAWSDALDRYPDVVEAQQSARLPELDAWYRLEFPDLVARRDPRYVTLDELARLTEWKMHRGVWRPRNLALVRGNDPAEVEEVSRTAIALAPDPNTPIRELARLRGVGPATASAVMAAAEPDVYPFFDELVAAQVPDLGPVDFDLRYYVRYARAIRERATLLGGGWTPVKVERALWANSGGKAVARP